MFHGLVYSGSEFFNSWASEVMHSLYLCMYVCMYMYMYLYITFDTNLAYATNDPLQYEASLAPK